MTDLNTQRKQMVDEQLIARGINNLAVLNAFKSINRHLFVPQEFQNNAYQDNPIQIGFGQTISQPYITALMISLLELTGEEKVLEIGTGSGYQTALLAHLSGHVYSVELIPELSKRAQDILQTLNYSNITLATADGSTGLAEYAPFDRIIISAAAPRIPLPLNQQLNENGIIVLPQGDLSSQTITVAHKKDGVLKTTDICTCVFVPLIGKYGFKKEAGEI